MSPQSIRDIEPTKRRLSLRTSVWKATVSIVLLTIVLYFVPFRQIVAALSGVALSPVLLSVFAVLAFHVMGSAQTRAIIRRQQIGLTIPAIFRINLITAFYSLFLPGTLAGGAIRWYYFSREPGKGAPALAAIAFNRVLDTCTLVLVGLVCFALDRARNEDTISASVLLGGAGLALLGSLLCLHPGLQAQVAKIAANRHLPAIVQGQAERFVNALSTYGSNDPRFHATVLFLAVSRHGIGIFGILLLATAMGLDLSFTTIGWFRAVLTLLLMLPISLGGFGVRELSFVGLLQPLGVAPAAAIGFSVLLLARNALVALIGGAIELDRVLRREQKPAAPEPRD